MWTPATRKQYSRPFLRYQSDATDEEWRMFEPFLPAAKRSVDHRPVASRDRQWNFLCHAFRLPMAPVAEGYAAVEQGLPLVCGLARCLRVREDQSLAGHAQAGTGRLATYHREDQPHGAAAPGADREPSTRRNSTNCTVKCAIYALTALSRGI